MPDGDAVAALWSTPPPLDGMLLRSLHLGRLGPALRLRLETGRLPDRAPGAWTAAGCDRVEFQLRLLAVADLRLRGLPDGGPVRFTAEPLPGSRLHLALDGAGVALTCTAHRTVGLSHASAYASAAGGPYDAPRHFLGRVDAMRHPVLPPTTRKTFYDHP